MASRTRSLSSLTRGRKAQFFLLSAFVMVAIMFIVSSFIQPSSVFDTSSAVLIDEVYIFNNIKEKAVSVVKLSDGCADLDGNIDEYRQFVQSFVGQRNARLVFNYTIAQPCSNAVMTTNFYVKLTSPRASIDARFTATK